MKRKNKTRNECIKGIDAMSEGLIDSPAKFFCFEDTVHDFFSKSSPCSVDTIAVDSDRILHFIEFKAIKDKNIHSGEMKCDKLNKFIDDSDVEDQSICNFGNILNEKKRKEFSQKLLLKGIESWVCFKHLPFDKSCDTRGDFKCHYDIVINDVPGKSAAMMSELVGDGECCSLLLTAVKNSVSRLKKGKGHPFYFDEVKVFTPKEFCDIVLTSLKTVQDDSDFDCGNPLLELVTYANGRSL